MISRTGSAKGAARAGHALGQKADAVGQEVGGIGHRLFGGHFERGVGLQTRDEAAARGVEFGPPAKVIVSQIKDIGHAGFDRHRLGRGDVIDPLAGEGGVKRAVGGRVVGDVQLDGARPIDPVDPASAQPGQLHPCGIENAQAIAQLPARAAAGGGGHVGEQFAKQRRRALGVGIGQRRPRHAAPAQMIEPGGLADQPRLDVAQARRARQLPEQQRQELALGGEPAHPMIGFVGVHKPIEDPPRNMLQKIMKNAIVVPHDIDPRSCLNAAKRLKSSRINVMHHVHQI